MTTSYKVQILEFFIYNRLGTCLAHIDLQEEQLVVVNKVLSKNSDKESENRYKLIYGLLFSMKSFIKNLSPNKSKDFLKSFNTISYKLHYIELLSGLRFVLLTTPIKMDLSVQLKEIYSAYYVNFISKNVFKNKDEPINNEIFLELIYNYLNNLNNFIN